MRTFVPLLRESRSRRNRTDGFLGRVQYASNFPEQTRSTLSLTRIHGRFDISLIGFVIPQLWISLLSIKRSTDVSKHRANRLDREF